MGLTASYEEFLADPKVRQRQFTAPEAEDLNDAASFSRHFRQDAERGRVKFLIGPDRDLVTITKVAKERPMTDGLKASDDASKAVQKTPWRVSLAAMERRIATEEYLYPKSIPHMTICVIVLDNGYALQGMSTPADPANFNEELGKKFAREDALRKMWPLEAYVMRDHLSGNTVLNDGVADRRWQE